MLTTVRLALGLGDFGNGDSESTLVLFRLLPLSERLDNKVSFVRAVT